VSITLKDNRDRVNQSFMAGSLKLKRDDECLLLDETKPAESTGQKKVIFSNSG
jgi:hypothetical protein